MSIKGIRVRYVDFLTLLSIFNGTVNGNYNSLRKCEIRLLLLDFNWNFELNAPLVFSFPYTLMSKKEIRVRYAELITLLSIFKVTADVD